MEGPPPPPVQMVQLLSGFQVSQALYVAAKIGVADRLVDGPLPVEQARERTRLRSPRPVAASADACVARCLHHERCRLRPHRSGRHLGQRK